MLDEYGDMKPEVYSTVIRPALADRKGWVVFMGTPKGKNDFYKRWLAATGDPAKYLAICLKASDSGILDDASTVFVTVKQLFLNAEMVRTSLQKASRSYGETLSTPRAW